MRAAVPSPLETRSWRERMDAAGLFQIYGVLILVVVVTWGLIFATGGNINVTNMLVRSVALGIVAVIGVGPALFSVSAQDSENEWFVQEELDEQMRQRTVEPEGSEDQPWIQMIEPETVDTSEYTVEPGWHVCFSNASVANPWRATGFTTMEAEVELHENIAEFTVVDAGEDSTKQISDIEDLLNRDCDILIVSPATTEALTPAVETACEQLPVIVFDRGVNTDCATTFIHPIGGYVFGAIGPSSSSSRYRRAATSLPCASCRVSMCWRRVGQPPSTSSTRTE